MPTALMTPTEGMNFSGRGFTDPGIQWQIAYQGGNPWARAGRQLTGIGQAIVQLQQEQFIQESQATAQSNLNNYKREIASAFNDYRINNQLQDAVEQRPALDQRLAEIEKRYQGQLGKANPIVRALFEQRSGSIMSDIKMDADAYKMQETARWRDNELQGSLQLTQEDYARDYQNDQLAKQKREAMEQAFDALMDNRGVTKNSDAYNTAKLELNSKLNKALIVDSINGDRFGEARHLINREMDRLTARDRYDLLNQLRNQEIAASMRNAQQQLLNDQLKMTPARRLALLQERKAAYLAQKGNLFKPVDVPNNTANVHDFVDAFSPEDEVSKALIGSLDAENNPTKPRFSEKLFNAANRSLGTHTVLVPKTQAELDHDASVFAMTEVLKVERETSAYQSAAQFGEFFAQEVADDMRAKGLPITSTQDVIDATTPETWDQIVSARFNGDPAVALKYMQGWAMRDTGNPTATSQFRQAIELKGVQAFQSEDQLNNLITANNLSPEERESVLGDWRKASISSNQSMFTPVKNMVNAAMLPSMSIDLKDDEQEPIREQVVNAVYNDMMVIAQQDYQQPLTFANYQKVFNSVMLNGGLLFKYQNIAKTAEQAINNVKTVVEDLPNFNQEQLNNLLNVAAANAPKVVNMTPEEIVEFAERNNAASFTPQAELNFENIMRQPWL